MRKCIFCFLLSVFLFFSKSHAQTELLANGDFTTGYSFWNASTYWWVQTCACPFNSGSGGNYAYFGKTSACDTVNNDSGFLFQDFFVPPGATNFSLSFAISINTREVAQFTEYDTLNIQIRNQFNNVIFQLDKFSNLDGDPFGACAPYNVFNYPMPALSLWAGQTVRVYFEAKNDIAKSTVFRIDDVAVTANLPTGCVTWNGGLPADPTLVTAAEYLCQNGVIDQNQFSSQINNSPPCKEVAYYIYNSLFAQNGYNAYSDDFPCPVVDILPPIIPDYSDAIKAMLYLDRSDGIPCFSRDFFNVGTDWGVVKGRAVRAVLEAWQISPDWTDSNPNSTNTSSFLCDVALNDQYYGWMKRAFDLGFFNGLTNSCSGNCPANLCVTAQNSITQREFYIILYRVMNYNGGTPPSISNADFFIPNSFKPSNLASKAETDRAVFSHYQKESFSIAGGGLPLVFNHSYHSNRSEMPFMPYEFIDNGLWAQRYFPIGFYWTHTYNTYILKIPNSTANNAADYRLMIFWGDGRVESYDPVISDYESSGVQDNFQITSYDDPGSAGTVTITTPDGVKYFFDRDTSMRILRLIEIRDRNNNSLFLNYQLGFDSLTQRLQSVTDQFSGRSLNFSYQGGTNFISSVTDNSGRVAQFNVNSTSKDLTDYYDAKNNHHQYQYGTIEQEKHLLKLITLPKGNTITNTYFKRKLQSSTSGNYNIQVNWNQNYSSGSSTTNSQVSVTQNGNTLTTNYTHDNRGNSTNITTPTSNVSLQYNDSNNPDSPTSITDNNTGITTTIQYEANKKANPIQVSKSDGTNTLTDAYLYNTFSQVTSHTNTENFTTTYTYDANGNLTDVNEPNGNHVQNSYSANGLLTQSTSPDNIVTNYHYNYYGNLDSTSIAGTGISSSAGFDAASRITSTRNPNGVRSTFSYDANDNITHKYFDIAGFNYHTQNFYDANDNLTQVIAPKGDTTNLIYNFQTDDLEQESYGSYNKQWTYNDDGTISSFRNKNSTLFNYLYLPQGDPNAGKLFNDGYSIYDYYSSTRNLNKVTHIGNSNFVTYTYDGLQRIYTVNYSDIPNNEVYYFYNSNSNNLNRIYYPFILPQFFAQYTYDNNNRITRVRNANTNQSYQWYVYKPNSDRFLFSMHGNGLMTKYTYDNIGRIIRMVTEKTNGDTLIYQSCTYDSIGNRTNVILNVFSNLPSNPPGSPPNDSTTNYSYDGMNRLVSANGATYSSNQNGSLVALNSPNGNSSFTWDDRDNLLTITGSLGNHVYEYDGLENRRRRDSTRYILDLVHNENVLMETNLAGVPTSIYIYGLGLECRIDPVTNAIYYYHFDFNGNTIAISDSSQQIVQEYTYNAFGRIKTANGNYAQAPGNPFTYVGKYGVIDEGNGLYFMRARYYDSNTGRFLSEDPKWDENLFPYANNNPVVYIDPNGESATSDAWNRGWQDAIERLNKSLSDPLTYETAFGGAMLMANGGKVGSISKQFTRSSPQFGQAMHKLYKTGQANRLTTFKEFTGIKGIRPDFVDFSTKTISELKPYNPRGIMQGDKQLNKYKSIFEKHYGGTWNTVLDTY